IGIGLQVLAAGLQRHGIVLLAFSDTPGADDIIDEGGEADDVDTSVKSRQRMRMDEAYNRFVDDDETGHEDEGAFDGGGEEFGFPVAVRVVFVTWFGRYVQAIKRDESGNDIYGALEGVGQDGHGLC